MDALIMDACLGFNKFFKLNLGWGWLTWSSVKLKSEGGNCLSVP